MGGHVYIRENLKRACVAHAETDRAPISFSDSADLHSVPAAYVSKCQHVSAYVSIRGCETSVSCELTCF